jgi:hypothetical protein
VTPHVLDVDDILEGFLGTAFLRPTDEMRSFPTWSDTQAHQRKGTLYEMQEKDLGSRGFCMVQLVSKASDSGSLEKHRQGVDSAFRYRLNLAVANSGRIKMP